MIWFVAYREIMQNVWNLLCKKFQIYIFSKKEINHANERRAQLRGLQFGLRGKGALPTKFWNERREEKMEGLDHSSLFYGKRTIYSTVNSIIPTLRIDFSRWVLFPNRVAKVKYVFVSFNIFIYLNITKVKLKDN